MLPGPLKEAVDVWTWKRSYSMQEVNSALSKVQLVGYSQKVVRPPFFSFTVCTLCSAQAPLTNECETTAGAYLEFDGCTFCSPGAVWSGAGLTLKFGLLTGQLQLDHSVSS